MSKKPLKDTLVGKLLGKATGLLPENGVLGVLKNVIDSDDSLSQEEKIEAQKHLQELYKAEVEDRDSARKREVEMAKAGKTDWMMMLTGIVGLASFGFMVYAVVYIPDMVHNDLFIHLMGMIEGLVVGNIFAYYYGNSAKN